MALRCVPDVAVLLHVKITKLQDGDLNKQRYLSYKITCLLKKKKTLYRSETSADNDLKEVTAWVYKLSAALNGGLAYIGNTE